jgi:hypothetical protein
MKPSRARRRRRAAVAVAVAVAGTVGPGIPIVLDSLQHLSAVVFNSRLDVLAANDLARALYAPVFDTDGTPNTALYL